MKIGGVTVKPCVEILVLPRMGENLIIRAKSVSVNEEFEKMVPEPIAPGVRTKDGFKHDYKDDGYRKQLEIREEARLAFMILRSIEDSNIEWETVDMDKYLTWKGWDKELQKAGLSEVETNRIINTVMVANALDESKIKEALDSFLLGQGE
jgi:hypothetical protein